MHNTSRPPRLAGLGEIAGRYRHLLCDAWGVLHNGGQAYAAALDALRRFRETGGSVLVITNAPRPKSEVLRQFDRYGVDPGCFDDVVSSGDTARTMLWRMAGARVFHLGPERDLPVLDGLDIVRTGEDDADLIFCTGLFHDDVETPDDYADRLACWAERGLPMMCANPDKVVERGNRLIWCAGALAERYAALGGRTTIVGKPCGAIYDVAVARFAALAGRPVDRGAILAVGDGADTDLLGAQRAALDVLFVAGGIHADVFGPRDRPDPDAVAAFLAERALGACGFMPSLCW